MVRVALTGGIACGKSLVAEMLRERGFKTLDADYVVHELLPEGERRRLVAEGVFRDAAKRKALEARLWPQVRERFDAWEAEGAAEVAENAPSGGFPARISVIPLLFEAHWDRKYDIICAVVSEERTQLSRMTDIRGYGRDEAEGRLKAQMPASLKAAQSHYAIRNDGTREELAAEVDRFVQWLKDKTNQASMEKR